jgi:ferrous-iron efflux pump FieF
VLAGVRIAAVPADTDHRFGHGKAEALAALAQVALIMLSALFIGYRSVERLMQGAQTTEAELGIGVSLVAILFTFALITYQRYVAQTFCSMLR